MNIVWVDDDQENEGDARILEERSRGRIRVDYCHPSDVLERLTNGGKPTNSSPSLVIIDYRLQEKGAANASRSVIPAEGFSGLFRASYPATPIYVVTSYRADAMSSPTLETFDWVAERKEIQEPNAHRRLIQEVCDYRAIVGARALGPALVARALACDASRANDVVRAFSMLEGRDFVDGDVVKRHGRLRFVRWLRWSLQAEPGILMQDEFAALHLGLKPQWFAANVVGRLVRDGGVEYQGAFSHSPLRCWWRSELTRWAVTPTSPSGTDRHLHDAVAAKTRAPSTARSRCNVCKELYPDAYALANTVPIPVHVACTGRSAHVAERPYFWAPREIQSQSSNGK